MERIFPNLYRFTDEPSHKGRIYSYLIVRKGGNLLLPCLGGGAVSDHLKDIERIGGVDTQFVTHNHDIDGALQEAVYARFGAKLCYHRADHKKVVAKTKCPTAEFSDDGLQLGSDFQALYFPSCSVGSSVYHWRFRGKHFLFTSHVINMVKGDWHVDLDLVKSPPSLAPQFAEIAKLPIDYTMPNVCRYGQEEFHRFNDYTRKAFSTALRAKVRRGHR